MATELEETLYPIRRIRTSSVSNLSDLRSYSLLFAELRVADPAVMPPVSEIDHQADHQPDNQARPVDPAKLVHHVPVEDDAHDRHERHQRRAERPRLTGIRVAQHHYRDAHD